MTLAFRKISEGGWCRLRDSNLRPDDYKSTALPTELSRLNKTKFLRTAVLHSFNKKPSFFCLNFYSKF